MQTTQELLKKYRQPSNLIKCNSCNKMVDRPPFTSVKVTDDIEEIGLICPNCQQWTHSYFLNDELNRNKGMTRGNRRQRRAYKKMFDSFNKKTRKRFNMNKTGGRWHGSPTSKGDKAKADEAETGQARTS